MLKYLVFKYEAVLSEWDLRNNDTYFRLILECLQASDKFLSTLYKSGLFLSRLRLESVVKVGKSMLKSYADCAAMALARSLARFKLNPKYHMLMHVILQLEQDRQAGRRPLNPLSYSCQMPEDFINRVSTLSRGVSPTLMAIRTIDLYNLALAKAW